MKALTLHQPYASLIAVRLKKIEARLWSTKYRGPLAIHAGARLPDLGVIGQFSVRLLGPERVLHKTPYPRVTKSLPLGAIVATCTLVDVVPIIGEDDSLMVAWERHVAENHHGALWLWNGPSATENQSTGRPTWLYDDITDQRPYGDFMTGRYAWLLEDIEAVDPIPAKGHQGLWEWAA